MVTAGKAAWREQQQKENVVIACRAGEGGWRSYATVGVMVTGMLLAFPDVCCGELLVEPVAAPGDDGQVDEQAMEAAPVAKELPINLSLTYSLYSDYIFRGVNFSAYPSEGREEPNHQLDVSLGADVGKLVGMDEGSLGTLGFTAWFEWYAAQKEIDPGVEGNLQEVDYVVSWAYDFEPIASTVTLGYVYYQFPHHGEFDTQEMQLTVEHNDAWMWQWLWPENDDGVLNPWCRYAYDFHALSGGQWIEFGVNHPFEVFDLVTITPSVTAAVDHHYLSRLLVLAGSDKTRLAYIQYGLNVDYDLGSALKIPKKYGGLTLSAFLYFNDAVGSAESRDEIEDKLFGGAAIAWSF